MIDFVLHALQRQLSDLDTHIAAFGLTREKTCQRHALVEEILRHRGSIKRTAVRPEPAPEPSPEPSPKPQPPRPDVSLVFTFGADPEQDELWIMAQREETKCAPVKRTWRDEPEADRFMFPLAAYNMTRLEMAPFGTRPYIAD